VDDDVHALSGLLEILRDGGHQPTGAATFGAAKQLLDEGWFDLLITDIRLHTFNGLELVKRGRVKRPGMGSIVVTGFPEPEVKEEALRYGAVYVIKPVRPTELLTLVSRTLATVRRHERKVIGRDLEIMIGRRRAHVLDISYTGLRFETTGSIGESLPKTLDIVLPGSTVSVRAELVWSAPVEAGLRCGAAIIEVDEQKLQAWRDAVDALPSADIPRGGQHP
jgi:CheY-like chemotaxis protein